MSDEVSIFRNMSERLQRHRDDLLRLRQRPIYGVPVGASKADLSAFQIRSVAIGPYHSKFRNIGPVVEDRKWNYMHNLLQRRPGGRRSSSSTDQLSDSADEVLKRCIDKVWQSRERVGRCYDYTGDVNDDFVMTLVLDGCFILELFLTTFYHDAARDDRIHAIPWMFSDIWNDLLKLGNQIPFFILQDLFTAIFNNNNNAASTSTDQPSIIVSMPSLEKLAFNYLKHGPLTLADPFFELLQDHQELEASSNMSSWRHVLINIEDYHLLIHVYHMLLRPTITSSTSTTRDNDDDAAAGTPAGNINNLQPRGYRSSSAISMFFEKVKKKINLIMPLNIIRRRSVVDDGRWDHDKYRMIPCVSELCDAGITVVSLRKPEKKEGACDVAFKDGVLRVPRLTVDGKANTVFRNLLALEQYWPGHSLHVTSYTIFLSCIVKTAKDVTILEQRGIINNALGSEDEVAQLFNRLGKDLPFIPESNYLHKVFTEVNDYCESKWHKYRASLARDYFSTPWSAISLFAAVALLLMTMAQVVFAILSYIKQ